jgi:hypothetical protein
MKNFLLTGILILQFTWVYSQDKKYPAEIEGKIRVVENNLAGWVQTGSDDRWNLQERMKNIY